MASTTVEPSPVAVPERVHVPSLQEESYKRAVALGGAIAHAGLEPRLRDLIDVRASQINGCAFCLDMHTRQAREHGETDVRLHQLGGWEEASVFTARERAALALTEAVTLVREGHVPDAVWQAAAAEFTEAELAAIVLAASMINFWNRVEIATRATPLGA